MTPGEVPARDQIDPRYTWNRESLFDSLESWERALERAKEAIDAFPSVHASFSSNACDLKSALDAAFELQNRVDHVLLYAALEFNVNTSDAGAVERNSRARGVLARVRATIAFLEPGIIQLGYPVLESWMEREPGLSNYRHYLEDLFRKAGHVRSEEIEAVMGMIYDPFSGASSTASMLTNADMQFGNAVAADGSEHEITQGSYSTLLTRPDRDLRRSAWEKYHDRYLEHKHTLASSLETSTKQAVFVARVRGHPSTLEAALFPHALPPEVFHNLLSTFEAKLPVWHRYFALRTRLLGIDRLQPYDVWAPLTATPPQVSFSQAVEWICEALAPLGADYVETVRRGALEERWIDVYPNRGKRQGAFSWGAPGTHPFIVMNYDDTLFRLSTLAHELGHSMHSYLCWQSQPLVYTDYSFFVAEVASNMHQALVRAYLFDTQTTPRFQIALIEEAMSNFHRYLLQMPTLARFEWQMHQDVADGRGLTADLLIERMADLLSQAYGETMDIDRPRVGMTWATFGHLYVYFYVFQYATGIAAAQTLARRLLTGDPGAREAYFNFLRCGGALHPLDALDLAGVDLRSSSTVAAAFDTIEDYTERLENLSD